MNQCIEFLKLMNKLNKILSIEGHLSYYQKAIAVNKDEPKVVSNMMNHIKEDKIERDSLLVPFKNIEELITNIMEIWPSIQELILSKQIDVEINTGEKSFLVCNSRSLSLYALIIHIIRYRKEFISLYNFIIENDFYNPNGICGVSDEPFFSMLPTDSLREVQKYNKKVIMNSKTDFHILRNGSDIIDHALYYYHNSKPEELKMYWQEFLLWSLKGNCSVLDSKRFHTSEKKFSYKYKPNVYSLFDSKNNTLKTIREYLLTEEGIQKQIENSIFPSLERNKAIDFYNSQLQEESQKRILNKLKI